MSDDFQHWFWSLPIVAPMIGVLGWCIRKIIYSVDEMKVRQIVDDKLSQINERTKSLEEKHVSLTDRLDSIEDKVVKTYDRVDNIYDFLIDQTHNKKV
jgi:hypothetical protein